LAAIGITIAIKIWLSDPNINSLNVLEGQGLLITGLGGTGSGVWSIGIGMWVGKFFNVRIVLEIISKSELVRYTSHTEDGLAAPATGKDHSH